MSTTFQIITNGCVYIYSRRELQFEAVIERVNKLLQGRSKGSTFESLYNGITRQWLVRDDHVKPFGDRRQNLISVCSINLDKDRLRYSDESGHIQIPLTRLREPSSDIVRRSEFTYFEVEGPPLQDLSEFPPPYQSSLLLPDELRVAFTTRVIVDFASQWRHILRTSYADSTLRRFAKAILSIATCDFTIDEVFTQQHIHFRSSYVPVLAVPYWEPCKHDLFRMGGTTIVLHQDLQSALRIAKNDAMESSKDTAHVSFTKQHTYLLLSIRHIAVCHVDSAGKFTYMKPTTFMDGIDLPSAHSINMLLQALSPAMPLVHTPIHKLPVELQDRILLHVSEGSVEAARLGCILGLGSPFKWMRAIDWPRRTGPIQLIISPSHRYEFSPVESKICFGDEFSGVSYW